MIDMISLSFFVFYHVHLVHPVKKFLRLYVFAVKFNLCGLPIRYIYRYYG